ncbi:MAG: hypothetical protein DCF15_19160 [Phormidesmis priestleyi]|uniref:Uncharacterized protein n=1 Tax=Phormidesmis priestleyi TaxID=268141 RepID=A0A2W4WSM6_9CYAN|nr:MAG: hypothetical protein DCF15_19160 [Phormidesmis priestleyi]
MVLFPQNNSSRLLILKKVLYQPLAGLALGLHLLLLIVPFNPSKPAPAESEKPPEEEAVIPVDILNLADVSAPEPPAPSLAKIAPTQPSSQTPNQTQIQSQSSAALPPRSSAAVPNSPSNPQPADPPNQPADGNQLSDGNQPPDGSQPTDNSQPPAYDPGPQRSAFIGNLGNIGLTTYPDRLPQPRFFKRPENAGSFLTNTDPPALVDGADSSVWMDKGVSTVFAQLKSTYEPSGVSFNPLDNYGGEVLYELLDNTGQPFQYVSLVELKGSTLIVNWPERPQ